MCRGAPSPPGKRTAVGGRPHSEEISACFFGSLGSIVRRIAFHESLPNGLYLFGSNALGNKPCLGFFRLGFPFELIQLAPPLFEFGGKVGHSGALRGEVGKQIIPCDIIVVHTAYRQQYECADARSVCACGAVQVYGCLARIGDEREDLLILLRKRLES